MYMIIDYKQIKSSKNKRFADLASLGEVIFHAGDLANVWGIKSKSTLYQTLSRYVSLGFLKRIYKGFYSLKNPNDIDPHLLGIKSLHTYAYISCETILARNGIINQLPQEITLVSNVSKRQKIVGRLFRSRKMSDQFLLSSAGIEMIDSVPTASVHRAIADMLYFNPKTYFDAHKSSQISWDKVREIVKKVGYNVHIPL